MAVYVDNMNAGYGRMKMCHMFADTEGELLAMADKIGVARRWHQFPGTIKSHFDICLSKRAKAVEFGANEIDYPTDVAELMKKRREKAKQEAAHA
ncbi:DUF4031 domain-containing protein [Metapseudomonas furukawaii]|uniref:DUF4031 domain-containing protein n=1 Tax=Metapseudomonas furukawaii TaxID=1149133 RepID=UPI00227B8BD8|nr:DUF4031 domain-containing protein [Pseudomonas furukawaii]WAG76992.1 DUF4031 domain-containing protein [Pseudomonas furukawaii]